MSSSKLTREEKLELLAALEEKRRRDLERRPKYSPNAGQMPVHKSRALDRFVFSGNGSGKTTLLANELAWALKGYNPITQERYPPGLKIIVVVDNTKKIGEVLIPEYRKWHNLPEEWLKRDGKPHISRIISDNGNEINFYSVESDPMLFEGIQAHMVFIDEPLPRHLFVALKRSLRIKGFPGRILFCGTPVSQPWLRTQIYEPWSKGELPNVEIFRVSSMVNKDNLAEGWLDNFGRALSEAEKAVRLEGSFFDGEGLALAHLWSRQEHIVPGDDLHWNGNWPVVIGIDPHPTKKHVAVMVGADPYNKLYVLQELSVKQTASEFAETLKEWYKGFRVVDIVVDSLGSAEGTGNEGFSTFIEQLRKHGVPARPTRYEDKSHEDLIDRLQSCLVLPKVADNYGNTIPKLRVSDYCKGVIENIESVTWQINKADRTYKPKLDTSAKDYLSALGYALAANVHSKRGAEKPVYLKKSPYRGLELKSQRAIKSAISKFRKS